MMQRLASMAIVCAVLGATVSACGASTPQEEVADTANHLVGAVRDGDYDAACDVLTNDAKQQAAAMGGWLGSPGDCPGAFKIVVTTMMSPAQRQWLERINITSRDVVSTGSHTALVRGLEGANDTTQFIKVDGDWRVNFE